MLKLSAAAGGAALLAACTPDTTKPAPSGSAGASASAAPSGRTTAGKYPLRKLEGPVTGTDARQLPIGKYGGTMPKAFFGAGTNDLSISRFMTGGAALLLWDSEWKTIKPNIARSFTVSPDNTSITVQLRRGMKWSNGDPFTADDIIFWKEDILDNEEVHPGLSADITIAGKKTTLEKIDDTTVKFVAAQAFPQLVEIMASPITDLGATFR